MKTYSSKHKSISIGIPAYNEEKTIQKLLQALLRQKTGDYILKEVIVVCDGSTDTTVTKVKAIKDSRIVLVHDKKRLGKSARLDQIIRRFRGDILFLIDADVIITDNSLFTKLCKQVDFSHYGLISMANPAPAVSFFQEAINTGVWVMSDIARHWNNGRNYLSFKGCFLGMGRKLAKQCHIPTNLVNNDAYFYFKAIELGYNPAKIEQRGVYYTSPSNFSDHLKQSSRYQSSERELQQYFSFDLSPEYHTPILILVQSTLRCFLQKPGYLLSYISVRLATLLLRSKHLTSLWDVAISTKQ